ncbi:hypothetical protein C3488_36755 [Streptomyces sp. Ru72]|nr:hypothetical protein C3488_36755 [Streptomyces sp. Ru72]
MNKVLEENRYPGRGVLWCRTVDGSQLGAYFLTGRSAASRARLLSLDVHGDLVVAPADEREHDHLRHYAAARQSGEWLVFGNGEQVATVADRVAGGLPLPLALGGLDYEPDPPIFTPRLTVIAGGPTGADAWFGAARRSSLDRASTDRMTLQVSNLEPGEGILMTTYRSDGHTIATGTPFHEVRTTADNRSALLEELWSALRPDLRIAAAVFEPGRLDRVDILQA